MNKLNIVSSADIKTIIYELHFSLSWMKDEELAKKYRDEIRKAGYDFLTLIKTTAFRDICGEVVGVRSCFGEYTAFVYATA